MKTSFENQISEEKNKAKSEAKNMMSLIIDQGKLTDYSVCHDDRVKDFKDKKYINKLCTHYYGDWVKNLVNLE